MQTIARSAQAAFVLALTALAHAEINPKNFDPEIRPQDDFYRYANGAWLKNNPVPAEESRWGGFSVLQEDNQKNLHTILER
ncbi:MAG: M13 family peptidase, partial [Opitutaceae bacterium]|nr:M13 family peptidase [Opitutaceae bacterium]